MDADLIAALERLRSIVSGCEMQAGPSAFLVVQCADLKAALDHIETLRNGGERAQIVALEAERDKLASIVRGWHWLAVGPDEMGDYLHQRELIKASEPYADPALKALAKP